LNDIYKGKQSPKAVSRTWQADSKDGLHQIDVKVDEFIRKLCASFNGHKKRITGMTVEMFKM